MIAAGAKLAGVLTLAVIGADITHVASIISVAMVVGGVFTLGVLRSVAWAWKEEKDAAVEKAERLAKTIEKAAGEREAMRARLDLLETQTNFDEYKQQTSKEHREIVAALTALTRQVMQSTTAIEFVAKQTFPNIPEQGGAT